MCKTSKVILPKYSAILLYFVLNSFHMASQSLMHLGSSTAQSTQFCPAPSAEDFVFTTRAIGGLTLE